MPIPPNKLKALVDSHVANPMSSIYPETIDADEALDADQPQESAEDPLTKGNAVLDSLGEFGQVLRETADILAENSAEVGEALAAAPSPDQVDEATEEMVEESVDRMPGDVIAGLGEQVAGLAPEDVSAMAVALADGLDGVDPTILASYLSIAAKYAATTVSGPEDLPEEEGDVPEVDPAPENPEVMPPV